MSRDWMRRGLQAHSNYRSCALCCCESWAPRQAELRQLETAHRSMLRKILGCRRAPDEPWVDWLCRTTRKAVAMAADTRVRNLEEPAPVAEVVLGWICRQVAPFYLATMHCVLAGPCVANHDLRQWQLPLVPPVKLSQSPVGRHDVAIPTRLGGSRTKS